MIRDTLELIEKELCIKFPPAPSDLIPSLETPLLFITNARAKYNCTSQKYDLSGPVVKMAIGYSCFNNKKAVAGNVIHMLKTAIKNKKMCKTNSLTLYDKFHLNRTIVPAVDRCFLNHNYFTECMNQTERGSEDQNTSFNEPKYRVENLKFYNRLLWPSGIVFYEVQEKLRYTVWHEIMAKNMALVEKVSCLKFHDISNLKQTTQKVVQVNGLIFFGEGGEKFPRLGFFAGNQTLNLTSIASGQKGYLSHTLNLLMRILGVTMMSNRHDRDSYISVNTGLIDSGREIFLRKSPIGAWLRLVPYDFKSVTHAPYNYMCSRCRLGVGTIEPVLKNDWATVTSMGQSMQLSDNDKLTLELLYTAECSRRNKK